MAIDLSEVSVQAELVAVVENLVTLREEALICFRWLNRGEKMCPPSFIITEL